MRKEHVLTALLGAFFTLLALVPVGYSLARNLAPHVATVDLQKLVEEEQERMLAVLGSGGAVTDEQRAAAERLTVDFATKLSVTIDALGAECGCVILNKAALLGGSTLDFTDQVRQRIRG